MMDHQSLSLAHSAADNEHARNRTLNKSCEGCRSRKIRCQPSENSLNNKCKRCEKLKLSCIYLAPQPKCRRKRTDVRVAELEKAIRSLQHRFSDGHELSSSESSHHVSPRDHDGAGSDILGRSGQHGSSSHNEDPGISGAGHQDDDEYDIEVDDATAELLLVKFRKDLVPLFPFLRLPEELTAKELRANEPVLLNAILAAASAGLHAPLHDALNTKAERLYAQHLFIDGNKSLGLVQALTITALWYHPPDRFSSAKFTTYAHLAADMALNLRIGRSKATIEMENNTGANKDDEQADGHRALLSCYVVCSTMAFSLRRPQMLPYSHIFDVCLKALATSSRPEDLQIAAWVQLQHIMEEALVDLGYDDIEHISLQDHKTAGLVKAYDRKLESWKERYWDDVHLSMKMHFYYARCSLHEISLYLEYNYDDFEPPYKMRSRPLQTHEATDLTPSYIVSVIKCIESAKAILDIFLTIDTTSLRSASIIVPTRAFHALVILSKVTLATQSPTSGVGKIAEPLAIPLMEYFQKIMVTLRTAAGEQKFSKPTKLLNVITRLAMWYYRQINSPNRNSADEVLEPLKELKTTAQDIQSQEMAFNPTMNVSLTSDATSTSAVQDILSPSTRYENAAIPFIAGRNQSTTQGAGFVDTGITSGADMQWFRDLDLQFQNQGTQGGFVNNFNDLGSSWNAGFLDDTPMVIFEGYQGNSTYGI